MLALVSTLAGNLLLVGSIANLIVVDLAQKSAVAIDWRMHARVGLPVTLLTLGRGVGLAALALTAPSDALSGPGITPAQLGGIVIVVQRVAMAVDAVIWRHDHFIDVHVGGNAGVLKQNTARQLATGSQVTAMADPGRARQSTRRARCAHSNQCRPVPRS